MKALTRNWKAVLAVLLLIVALLVWFLAYRPAKTEFESKQANLTNELMLLQMQVASTQAYNEEVIRENKKYEPLVDKLPEETAKLARSESELLSKFPAEMREEDQIMYMVWLENVMKELDPESKNDVHFAFASYEEDLKLNGASFGGITLNYTFVMHYKAFQRLIDYLSADERIASVRYVTMNYDESTDQLIGTMGIKFYMAIPNDYNSAYEYTEPDVPMNGGQGKDNVYTTPGYPENTTPKDIIPGIRNNPESSTQKN
ncbi:MAG: hypothetical protein E7423_00685 [Ruminococcaceae bacterium]|jgi:hypothetical protein|nr:hypothetical protein [Oscillospiraceae bacterium]